MRSAVAVLVTLVAVVALTVAPPAGAKSWATGAYRGTIGKNVGGKGTRGKVRLKVTRRRLRVDRITMILTCDESGRQRFTIRHAGSTRLKEGPAGAGTLPLRRKRTIRGYELEWSLIGGVHGSRFLGNLDAFAELETSERADRCELFGYVRARRR